MSVTISHHKTSRFQDRWSYFPFGILLLMSLLMVGGTFLSKTLIAETLTINSQESITTNPISLDPNSLGALRVDVKASIPNNHWLVYEIQILDTKNNLIASAVKEAWKESGIWREDGETGTWTESDLLGGLDVNARQPEDIIVGVKILEMGDTTGSKVNLEVPFRVKVQTGVIDTRYFFPGFVALSGLGIISLIATLSGKKVLNVRKNDSDPGGE